MKSKYKFKIDENLPPEFAFRLASEGYEACTVKDQSLNGLDDETIATVCRAEKRVLITQDLGFGDIRIYPPGDYYGIIVLRTKTQDYLTYTKLLERILANLKSIPLKGRLWIVSSRAIRIRRSEDNGN